MNLRILSGSYQVIKLKPCDEVPVDVFCGEFGSVTKTDEEISVVAHSKISVKSRNTEQGWKIIKIDEVLDFGLTGILSKISRILADNDISVFAVSTYSTDYIMVKEQNIDKAKKALTENNYRFD